MPKRTLRIRQGRTLQWISLSQRSVYSGLLEGMPTRELNERTIRAQVERTHRQFGHPPVLLPPRQTPIEHEGRYPFGEPARLPSIECTALFRSLGPTSKRPDLYYSELAVLWYQDDFAFPIAPEIEASLLDLDWDRFARDDEP